MGFRIVRNNAATTATPAALTPIPGLRVEIQEDIDQTPVAIQEVLTDADGRPLTSVVVDSESNVTIISHDETIAQFAASGPASEFSTEAAPDIVATPMVDAGEACLKTIDGERYVEFRYKNINPGSQEARVPITALNPDLQGTPSVQEDDLLLNSLRYSNDQEEIPDAAYRTTDPDDTKQIFSAEKGSFDVPFQPELGSLTWHFIGTRRVVDSSTALCENGGEIGGCTKFEIDLIFDLFDVAKTTVIDLTKAIVKEQKKTKALKGDLRKPYFTLMAQLLKRIRQLTSMPDNSYTCQEVVASCIRVDIPKAELMKQFDKIFKVKLPKQLRNLYKRAPKDRKKYLAKLKALPDAYVYCPDNRGE